MSRFLQIALLGVAAATVSAPSWAAANLLSNGSFETYTATSSTSGTFANWTTGGTTGTTPSQYPIQQPTNGTSSGQYGDVVAPDPYKASPDSAGSNAVFFVADNANQSLTQTISLVIGKVYEVGFDLFKTTSGANNSGTFTISGLVGGTAVTTASSTSLASGVWTHYAATFIASTTTAAFALNYVSGATPAADVLVDLAYVTAVPEPASLALVATGLLGLLALRRRQA